MRDAAIVFAAQFAYVVAIGLQSQAVNAGRYTQAALQSLFLGTAGFYITAQIARRGDVGSSTYFAYVAAGPLGITVSMYLFNKMRGKCK